MESVDSILEFWFGIGTSATEIENEKKQLWWVKDEDVDLEIITRFQDTTESVANEELDEWESTPKGMLASIICLDQFPRNMCRGMPKSFAYDSLALALANKIVDISFNIELEPIYRIFAYLPFEHSEEMKNQETSLRFYGQLRNEVPESDKEFFNNFYGFANGHYEFIERFGRYPHRNEVLGRESTKEELAFLSQPGSSF